MHLCPLTEDDKFILSFDLFGVALHFLLSLWKKLNVVCPVDFLSNCSNFISNGKLERNTHTLLPSPCRDCKNNIIL